MSTKKHFDFRAVAAGDFLVSAFGRDVCRAATEERAADLVYTMRRDYILKRREEEKRGRVVVARERSVLAQYGLYRRHSVIQQAMHEAYNGMMWCQKHASGYNRHFGGIDRRAGELAEYNCEAAEAGRLYDKAARAYHAAAVARRAGDVCAVLVAYDLCADALYEFDALSVYGCVLELSGAK